MKTDFHKYSNLKVKIAENANEPEYYTLENCPAIKKIEEWEKQHPQEVAEIDRELESEMQSYQKEK
ncbi:hypothetical protein BKN38_06770 [Helicobacter sp. CLO-3]|uniref:hypothetical protein n=1 Tax=unclassified Helicobacter TaxID=2593540 RepID=UPI000804F011|nr:MULTISPECIES: hypothetical protein [unclassified Helicobacter]OBV29351.1 hypothetical protein BA723_05735 [Helicobacter sp. CLO-3]OHU82609.1 hypothetical protein BKN38_06770 [Helicobacter sp. CLO-3]